MSEIFLRISETADLISLHIYQQQRLVFDLKSRWLSKNFQRKFAYKMSQVILQHEKRNTAGEKRNIANIGSISNINI